MRHGCCLAGRSESGRATHLPKTSALAEITLTRDGDTLRIQAEALGDLPEDMILQVVAYNSGETVEIRRGENRGRTISYSNIVQGLDVVGDWDGDETATFTHEVSGDGPFVALLQEAGHGAIVAAARLK